MDIDYINIILVDKQRKVLKVFTRTSDRGYAKISVSTPAIIELMKNQSDILTE